MRREELVLAAMAPADGAPHTPVQLQKLIFLISKNFPNLIDKGHGFNFQPYNYGPFDIAVYQVLEVLQSENKVDIDSNEKWKTYRLTVPGQKEGEDLLNSLPDKEKNYLCRISSFVRSLSFVQLVTAIYKAYPDMRKNSVFQET